MQKLIAKYGLAAHLSLLAVAPLFLFPFCSEQTMTVVMLWLSALAGVWVLMEPSVLGGETPHEARRRVVASLSRDPLFWVSLALVVLAAVRALNGGVGLCYDAEAQTWSRRVSSMPLMPACCGNAGSFLFAGALAFLVLLQGTRHAMGKSARGAFVLISSALAGVSAFVLLLGYFCGKPYAIASLTATSLNRTLATLTYGVYFIAGTVALIFAFERKWNRAILLLVPSIGGTGAGLWAFADPSAVVVFAAIDIPIILYAFFYAHRVLRRAGEFKCLVVYGICLTIAVVSIMAILPPSEISARMAPILSGEILSDKFLSLRKVLGGLSLGLWKENPWLGTGLGSFSIDLRLVATEENWLLIPDGQRFALNGWWQLLVERGILGALMVGLPLALLLFSYGRSMWRGIKTLRLPHPMALAGPLVLAAVVALAFVDSTVFRPELVLSLCALMAISANSFPKEKSNG